MSNFSISFKCEGSRDQPPKKDKRGNDHFQLRSIHNKCTLDRIDGLEYFEIEYWEKKNGSHSHIHHMGSQVRARYPKQVYEWEKKYKAEWERVYGDRGNIISQQRRTKPFQDQSIGENDSKRRKLSIPSGQLNNNPPNELMPPSRLPISRSNASNKPHNSSGLSDVSSSRSNLMLPPEIPVRRSNVPASYSEKNGTEILGISNALSKSKDSGAQSYRMNTNSMPPSRISASKLNGSMLPPNKPASRSTEIKLPQQVQASRSNGSMLPRYRPNRSTYSSEVMNDKIEDSDEDDSYFNKPKMTLKRTSTNRRPNSMPNRSSMSKDVEMIDSDPISEVDQPTNRCEDEMDADSSTETNQISGSTPTGDEMDIDSLTETNRISGSTPTSDKMDIDTIEINQIGRGKSTSDEMDVDTDTNHSNHGRSDGDDMGTNFDISTAIGALQVNEILNGVAHDRYIEEYQEEMRGHIEAIYQTSQRDLMQVVENTTDGSSENEGIPAIIEPMDLDSDLPVSSPGKIFFEYSEKLIQAHSEGLSKLIEVTLNLKGFPCDNWVSKRINVGGSGYLHFINALMIMLAGIDKRILKHLVEGNLPIIERQPENYGLSSKLKNMRAVLAGETKTTNRPYIYIQYLVDRSGRSPNPEDMGKILDYVQLYLQGFNIRENQASNECALEIDTALHTSKYGHQTVDNGYRRYASAERNPRSQKWKKTILQWVETTRDRLRHSDQNEPLSRPLVEVGYATSLSRLDEHKNHTGSNYIMNLVEAICKAYFHEKWSIKQYVLFRVAHHTHAMFGEILCTRLAQAYTTHGGGFCHHAAGISLGAVHKMDDLYWRSVQRELLNVKHGFWDNMRGASSRTRETTQTYNATITARNDVDTAVKKARAQLVIDSAKNWDEEFRYIKPFTSLREILERIEEKREREISEGIHINNMMDPLRPLIIELINMTDEEEEDIAFNNNLDN